MNTQEMVAKIQELQELKRLKEELDQAIEAAQDEIKAAMGDNEMATYGQYKVTYKVITQNRLDSTALKRELPEVAARYSKQVVTRPLKVS